MSALTGAREAASAAGLTLLRAVPRGEDRLLVTLRESDGGEVSGQWFEDPRRCAATSARTEAVSEPGAVRTHGRHLLVQRRGADRRLAALHRLVAEGHDLVAHRPERRGVVRDPDGGSFTKVVPADRAAGLADGLRQAATWSGVRVPEVLGQDDRDGTVRLATLPGRTLHDLLGTLPRPALLEAAHAVGAALARLHAVPAPAGVAPHDLDAEVAVTQRWLTLACERTGLDLDRAGLLRGARARAAGHPVAPAAVLHRDLHDKQLLLDGDEVSMLDLDLVARGEPALDLANLLVHLELRAHQGTVPLGDVRPLADAVLAGYRPDAVTRAGLPLYAGLTRLRLVAVYAFRPADGEVGGLTTDPVLEDLC